MLRASSNTAFAKPIPSADSLGIGVSALCAIHCAAPAVVVALAPAVSTAVVISERLGWTLIAAAALVAAVALWRGFRGHRAVGPALLSGSGFAVLICGELLADQASIEVGFGLTGSALMVAGHLFNVWSLPAASARFGADSTHI